MCEPNAFDCTRLFINSLTAPWSTLPVPSGGNANIDAPRSLSQKRGLSRIRFLMSRGTPLHPSRMRVFNLGNSTSALVTKSPVTRVCLKSIEVIKGAHGKYDGTDETKGTEDKECGKEDDKDDEDEAIDEEAHMRSQSSK